MKSYLYVLAIPLVLLMGCSSISTQFKKMVEPNSGDRARIRVTANMLVKGVPNSTCTDWDKAGAGTIFGGILGSSGYKGRQLGMPNPENVAKNISGEFYVTANQPITISLHNTPESSMRCSVAGTFVPKSNKDYQVDLSTGRKGISQSICKMRVREISSSGFIPVTIKKACESIGIFSI